MKRRNRKVVFIAFIIALVLGLILGVALMWSNVLDPIIAILPTAPQITPAPTREVTEPEEEPIPTLPGDEGQDVLPEEQVIEDTTTVAPAPEETPVPEPEVTPEPTPEPAPEVTPEPEPQPTEQPIVAYVQGERGDGIIPFQQKLIDDGFLEDTADGIFGAKTETAVREYQKANGLEETGTLNEQTQKSMLGISEQPVELAQSEKEPETTQTLSYSMGEKMEFGGRSEMVIERYDFNYLVEPSNPTDSGEPPTSFEATNSANTFLYMTGTITNTSDSVLTANTLRVSAYSGSAQEYSGYAVFESEDGKDLKAYGELQPGASTKIILLIEVPNELEKNESEAIVASIVINNVIGQITLR